MRVVAGVRGEPGEQLVDERILAVDGAGDVGAAFLVDRAGVDIARGAGRAEAAETVRRVDTRLVPQRVGEAAHGAELGASQGLGVVFADQVGASDGAVQHRPAREGGSRFAVDEGNGGEMVWRVARGVHGPKHDVLAHRELVAVPAGDAIERHLVAGGDDIAGGGATGQFKAAAHVVVVQVGLENQPNLEATFGHDLEDPVGVPLWVDDGSCRAVNEDIAPVAERLGLDRDDLHVRVPFLSLDDAVLPRR